MSRPRGRRLASALVAIAILGVLVRQAVSAFVIAPGLNSPDARTFAQSYFTARQWGYGSQAERAARPASNWRENPPNVVRPMVDDVLFARDIEVSDATPVTGQREYDDERRITVTYQSAWRDSAGSPPGKRHYFVRIGRDAAQGWLILGMGTGP